MWGNYLSSANSWGGEGPGSVLIERQPAGGFYGRQEIQFALRSYDSSAGAAAQVATCIAATEVRCFASRELRVELNPLALLLRVPFPEWQGLGCVAPTVPGQVRALIHACRGGSCRSLWPLLTSNVCSRSISRCAFPFPRDQRPADKSCCRWNKALQQQERVGARASMRAHTGSPE